MGRFDVRKRSIQLELQARVRLEGIPANCLDCPERNRDGLSCAVLTSLREDCFVRKQALANQERDIKPEANGKGKAA